MGRKYKYTRDERIFCGSLPKEITSKKGVEMFFEKYGKKIDYKTFRDYRKKYSGYEPPEIDAIRENPYEDLAIAIIRQAFFDARLKAKHGDDWSAERAFFAGDFIKKNFVIDGDYFIREIEEYGRRWKEKRERKINGLQ